MKIPKWFKGWFRKYGVQDDWLAENEYWVGERIAWRAYRKGKRDGKKLSSGRLEMKWISVKDRLPTGQWESDVNTDFSEEVLIVNSCAILIGVYNKSDGIWYTNEPADCEWVDKVTHWMPLPKNPHEGGAK